MHGADLFDVIPFEILPNQKFRTPKEHSFHFCLTRNDVSNPLNVRQLFGKECLFFFLVFLPSLSDDALLLSFILELVFFAAGIDELDIE
jgi:hypothetical protein